MKYIILLIFTYNLLLCNNIKSDENMTYEELVKDYQSAEFLNKAVNEINKSLPIMISKNLRMDSTIAAKKIIIYKYTILDFSKQYDNKYFKNKLKPYYINYVCTSEGVSNFPRYGVTLEYNFYKNNGEYINKVIVKPKDCKNLK